MVQSGVIPSQPMSHTVWPRKNGQMISAVPRWISCFIASHLFQADDAECYAGGLAVRQRVRLGEDVGDPYERFIDCSFLGDVLRGFVNGDARVVLIFLFVANREAEILTALAVRFALLRLADVAGEDCSGRGSFLLFNGKGGADVLLQPAPEGIDGNDGFGSEGYLWETRTPRECVQRLIRDPDQLCGLLNGDCQRCAGDDQLRLSDRDRLCFHGHLPSSFRIDTQNGADGCGHQNGSSQCEECMGAIVENLSGKDSDPTAPQANL